MPGPFPSSDVSHSELPQQDADVVPVGLNFGPTKLTIACLINHERTGYIASDCGDRYQSFFQYTLRKGVALSPEHDSSEGLTTSANSSLTRQEIESAAMAPIISKHIKDVVRDATKAYDHEPHLMFRLMALTVPNHWDRSTRKLVADAASMAQHPLDGPHMVLPSPRAIHLSFQMSKNTQGNYLTLVLDFNRSYLHLMLLETIETYHCAMKRETHFPHLGEDKLHKTPNSNYTADPDQTGITRDVDGKHSDGTQDDPKSIGNFTITDAPISDLSVSESTSSDNGNSDIHASDDKAGDQYTNDHTDIVGLTGGNRGSDTASVPDKISSRGPVCHNKESHFKPIVEAVARFMVSTLEPTPFIPVFVSSTLEYTPRQLKEAMLEVAYIVIDGEASYRGLDDVRDAMKTFASEHNVLVKNMRYCGAYGAAVAAKQQFENPKHVCD